jgi:hypothetical protein
MRICCHKPTLAICLVAALVRSHGLASADDDVIGAQAAPAAVDAVHQVNVNIDGWLFPGTQNAEAGRHRLITQSNLQIAEIARHCRLTSEQEEKLKLAASGDLERFFVDVEKVRRKFTAANHDRDAINEMWQEVQPLQARQSRGLTGVDSLFDRTLAKTLTSEQRVDYEKSQLERRKFRYRAAIASALHALEGNVALQHQQRQALTNLLSELPPPKNFGQYDQMLVNYRLATLDRQQLKPLFDDRQWQRLEQQFAQAIGYRTHLVEQGYLDRDEAAKQGAKP